MRIVFFDLETGGLDSSKHPIIQIAAVAVDENFRVLEQYQAKIDFNREEADPEALKMNHFDEAVWQKEQQSQSQVIRDFSAFLKRFSDVEMISQRTGNPYRVAQLAGHNAAEFDAKFLQKFFERHATFLPASYRVLDTCQRAQWYALENHMAVKDFKLGTLCKRLGVPLDDAHDALADVHATVAMYQQLLIPIPF